MKASMILALPFLVLASAAPTKLDERQPIEIPELKPNVKCALKIARSIHVCFPDIVEGDPVGLTEINTCLAKLSKTTGRVLRLETVPCVF
ncbi:hypothetical protein FLAG1_09523 [Fusarium langsethiae]|uniref:Uncharacterized protein n=1 Tax=Fusarium langsethiae TaxID=179993 RepID=A0A0M9EQ90_FUSLA|nr:hypothetical protein FLAG1_09523 [Fusarium langsethiae]GKU07390.1 unnamed protein product [Fusarium langsethiae]GKU22989.1 unnamed protein product [Fusarium langsethiae]